MKIKNRPCALAGALALCAAFGGVIAEAAAERPNIVFILADDLGYGDLACYGNRVVQTPNIDSLAEEGIRFTQCYSSSPVCGPSRVSLLTGRYSERSGYRMALPPRNRDSSLDEPWLMRQLQANGYATSAFGKWHIGSMKFRERGFDEWAITAPGGYSDYYDYRIYRNNAEKPEMSDGTYATDFLTDEALGFIDRHTGDGCKSPFFMYLAYTAPHFPLQVPDEDAALYKNKGLAQGTEIVYGMITRMDRNIGRILTALAEKGIRDNTLIVFTSDNGPEMIPYKGLGRRRENGGLAGEKAFVLEGGIRVPCIAVWPEGFAGAQRVFKVPMHGVDWAPTILEAAGVAPTGKPFDGVSYLETLRSGREVSAPARFWCCNYAFFTSLSNAAMRDGDWKIYRPYLVTLNHWGSREPTPPVPQPAPWQLFNLAADPAEEKNLADKYPERVMKMTQQFECWWMEVLRENEQLGGPAGP